MTPVHHTCLFPVLDRPNLLEAGDCLAVRNTFPATPPSAPVPGPIMSSRLVVEPKPGSSPRTAPDVEPCQLQKWEGTRLGPVLGAGAGGAGWQAASLVQPRNNEPQP